MGLSKTAVVKEKVITGYPDFVFEADRVNPNHLFASVVTEEGGTRHRFCTLIQLSSSKKWYVSDIDYGEVSGYRYKLKDLFTGCHFDRGDTAAMAVYFTLTNTERIKKELPLPEDVERHLMDRARTLQDRRKHLESELLSLYHEEVTLRRLAAKNQVGPVQHHLWKSDTDEIVKGFLEFEVGGKRFFTESFLYALLGKDDARTLLGRVKQVCNLLAPFETVKGI